MRTVLLIAFCGSLCTSCKMDLSHHWYLCRPIVCWVLQCSLMVGFTIWLGLHGHASGTCSCIEHELFHSLFAPITHIISNSHRGYVGRALLQVAATSTTANCTSCCLQQLLSSTYSRGVFGYVVGGTQVRPLHRIPNVLTAVAIQLNTVVSARARNI